MRTDYFVSIISLVAIAAIAPAQSNDFSFSSIPVSNAVSAIGGNQVAIQQRDVVELTANPAFIDSAYHRQAAINYLNYLADINQAGLAYAQLIDSAVLFNAYGRYLNFGTFTETDEVGNELGQFSIAGFEIGAGLSKSLSDRLSIGATWKHLIADQYLNTSIASAIDFGVRYELPAGLAMGATLDDLGFIYLNAGKIDLIGFSPSLNFGLSKKFSKAPLMLALQYNRLNEWDLAKYDLDEQGNVNVDPFTGEQTRRIITFNNLARHLILSAVFAPSEKFRIMGGFNVRRRLELAAPQRPALVGFSLGTQIRVRRFTLMYTIASYHLNGASNYLGIATNLNDWNAKKS